MDSAQKRKKEKRVSPDLAAISQPPIRCHRYLPQTLLASHWRFRRVIPPQP